jgi:hypothetical protein
LQEQVWPGTVYEKNLPKVFLIPGRGFISAERFTWVVLFHLGFVELSIRLPIISGFRTGIFDLNSNFLRFPVSDFKQAETADES